MEHGYLDLYFMHFCAWFLGVVFMALFATLACPLVFEDFTWTSI